MPNHCYNGMTINGNGKTVAEIWEKHFPLDEDGERHFDFNTVIPYPQQFLDQDKVCEEHRKTNPNDWSVKDGFNSGGYEWCVNTWGTKWNAYDQEVDFYGDDNEGYIRAEFYTAWSPPEGIFAKLCEMYPDVEMNFAYEEAGMCYEGTFVNENGTLVNDFHKDHSKRILRGG